jgi:hypothetical protein
MSSTDIDDLDPFSDYGYAANRFAARATQAWLLGRGLAAETQDLQRASEAGPLPAPGLFQALRLLGDACTASCNAAGTVFVLCGEDPEVDTKLAIYRALATVHTSTLEAERWMRRIAALCGGISAHLGAADEVERADRAAVIALRSGDEPMQLVDDGLWHLATTFPELSTELAGYFFRMIVEHNSLLRIESTSPTTPFILGCRFDASGNLTLTLDKGLGKGLEIAPLLDEGWEDDGGGVTATWDDPFAIREPVQLIIDTLEKHLGVISPTDVDLSVRSLPMDELDPPRRRSPTA